MGLLAGASQDSLRVPNRHRDVHGRGWGRAPGHHCGDSRRRQPVGRSRHHLGCLDRGLLHGPHEKRPHYFPLFIRVARDCLGRGASSRRRRRFPNERAPRELVHGLFCRNHGQMFDIPRFRNLGGKGEFFLVIVNAH
jgi:hypothetical protein